MTKEYSKELNSPVSSKEDVVRWGILSTARIAIQKVIPGMQKAPHCRVVALASRDLRRAREACEGSGIPKAYGSYADLLADPEIDAVYNPLPNHLHVPFSEMAARSGKHVLCEKPLACSAQEAARLLQVRDETDVLIQEAFMVRTHPQWIRVRDLVRDGTLGRLVAVQAVFSYFNRDPTNIRNIPEYGGGGLLDIGCYPVNLSRFIIGREPSSVSAVLEFDPEFGIDRLTTGILDYGDLHAGFVCSTQMTPYQRMHFIGQKAHVEVEIPFNAPNDRPCRLFLRRGDIFGADTETIEIPTCDQYTVQGEAFSQAILGTRPQAVSLEDSINNLAVLDALRASSLRRTNVDPKEFTGDIWP